MIADLFEWIVIGGAGWVVVEDEATRYSGRPMARHCVPVGGRTARYCAETVLRLDFIRRSGTAAEPTT